MKSVKYILDKRTALLWCLKPLVHSDLHVPTLASGEFNIWFHSCSKSYLKKFKVLSNIYRFEMSAFHSNQQLSVRVVFYDAHLSHLHARGIHFSSQKQECQTTVSIYSINL